MFLPREEHGLRFETPATTWDEAFPLGNGILGALVWGDGQPLKISLDRTDLWDLRKVPEFHSQEYSYKLMRQWESERRFEDLRRVYEEPYHRPAPTRLPAGRIELSLERAQFRWMSLLLDNAIAGVNCTSGIAARIMVHATEPVGAILIRTDHAVTPRLLAPAFGSAATDEKNSLAQLDYAPPKLHHGSDFLAFTQDAAEGFSYAACLAWVKTHRVWYGTWSVASSFESNRPLALARKRAEQARETGFQNLAVAHRDWWHAFWSKSTVGLPNKLLEKQWFLEQYKFGSASRKGFPPITLQGPWTADDGKLPPWKGDYHHDLNTELSYWPCYTANRLEEGENFLEWLWKTLPNCRNWTRRFFDMPGLNVPMTADLTNDQIGGWRQYTHSATTAAWLCHHFYLHWRYSGDESFLRERAWPYLREVCLFIEAVTAEKDAGGLRTLPLSSSPEINDNKPEAWFPTITNYDLALIRWLLSATAELAERLSLSAEAQHWREVLAEMPQFSLGGDGRLLVAKDYPLPASHRHFSHLMAIHPLGLIDVSQGTAASATIRASLAELERLGTDWWCGYSFAWLACLQARARNGGAAEAALEVFARAFTLRNSFHCNGDQSGKGYSKFTYRPFTLEGNFAAAAAIQEMLLQSHGGKIVVFPAVPESWREISFSSLRAQGAFLISARRVAGKTRRVEIVSEKGGPCRLVSPFTGRLLTFKTEPGQKMALTRGG
jgi:alpha-L-fucosidase 2